MNEVTVMVAVLLENTSNFEQTLIAFLNGNKSLLE